MDIQDKDITRINATCANGMHANGTGAPRTHDRRRPHARLLRRASPEPRPGPENEPLPAVIELSMVPGRPAMIQLTRDGILTPLCPTSGYLTALEGSLEGRARVAAAMTPNDATACMDLARWVWVGGAFPDAIDLISSAHFRADKHGRRVRAYKRSVPDDHLVDIGALTLTSPTRTACDLGCRDASKAGLADGIRTLPQDLWVTCLRRLIAIWNVPVEECLRLIRARPQWIGRKEGITLFELLRTERDAGSGNGSDAGHDGHDNRRDSGHGNEHNNGRSNGSDAGHGNRRGNGTSKEQAHGQG